MYFWIMSQCDITFDLKINVGHSEEIMSQCDVTLDLIINVFDMYRFVNPLSMISKKGHELFNIVIFKTLKLHVHLMRCTE